jgi:hypothetical protein
VTEEHGLPAVFPAITSATVEAQGAKAGAPIAQHWASEEHEAGFAMSFDLNLMNAKRESRCAEDPQGII